MNEPNKNDSFFTFPVEAGSIKLFARACGDHSEKFSTSDAVAPPTFLQSSAQYDKDYYLRPKEDKPWFGSGKNPSGLMNDNEEKTDDKKSEGSKAGGLHAEQHFEFHRPITAGMVLSVRAAGVETWVKEGRRGGKLQFTKQDTEYRDQDGNLIVTATSVGVTPQKVVG